MKVEPRDLPVVVVEFTAAEVRQILVSNVVELSRCVGGNPPAPACLAEIDFGRNPTMNGVAGATLTFARLEDD